MMSVEFSEAEYTNPIRNIPKCRKGLTKTSRPQKTLSHRGELQSLEGPSETLPANQKVQKHWQETMNHLQTAHTRRALGLKVDLEVRGVLTSPTPRLMMKDEAQL